MPRETMDFRRALEAERAADETKPDGRRAWIAPVLHRMEASDARNGIDPIVPDGPLSFGS